MTTKTLTTGRPITLHSSCHVPDSFCDGIELSSIPYQKLVPETSVSRLTDTRASFWYHPVSVTFVDGFRCLFTYLNYDSDYNAFLMLCAFVSVNLLRR